MSFSHSSIIVNLSGDLTNRVVNMEKLLDEMSHQSSIHTQKLDTIDGVIMAVGEYITLIKKVTYKCK